MARKIGIIGLGYAGLHTALAFGKKQQVIGFDIDHSRIEELKNEYDRHGDFSTETLSQSQVTFSSNMTDLAPCNLFVIIVPTPIKSDYEPDFSYLESASSLVASLLKPGDIVSYESTVYPGVTEEICLPILEKESGLKLGKEFKLGYSPERINPGDKTHTFENIIKIVAASDLDALKIIAEEYAKITNQVYCVANIKTAEAVKITENIQRDVNIALINELARIFHLLKIDTTEVLEAAKTKWNFIPYQPGLVGGHCISVDPYYLISKATRAGYSPSLMLAARSINENVSQYIAHNVIKHLVKKKAINNNTKVGILGITYKENYDDIRNSKAVDLFNELKTYDLKVYVTDPIANKEDVFREYGIELTNWENLPAVEVLIITVAHKQFKDFSLNQYHEKLTTDALIVDIKSILDKETFINSNIKIWRL